MSAPLVGLAMLAGALVALQGGINNTLRSYVRAPIGAALISFAVGFVVLCLLLLGHGEGLPSGEELASVPWWGYLGGPCGAVGVGGTILLVPRLGAAMTVALSITGQMLMSLVLDAGGLLGVPERPLSGERLLGALVVVAGAVLISWRASAAPRQLLAATGVAAMTGSRGQAIDLAGVIGGLAVGAILPTQSAINARLREGLDAPFTAAAVSFLGGIIILAAIVVAMRSQRLDFSYVREVPWWAWLGGIYVAIYVASTVVLVPEFGTAVTTALIVSGQNVIALMIDHYGWVRLPRRAATGRRLIGVVALLMGVVLIQLG